MKKIVRYIFLLFQIILVISIIFTRGIWAFNLKIPKPDIKGYWEQYCLKYDTEKEQGILKNEIPYMNAVYAIRTGSLVLFTAFLIGTISEIKKDRRKFYQIILTFGAAAFLLYKVTLFILCRVMIPYYLWWDLLLPEFMCVTLLFTSEVKEKFNGV